MSRSVVLPHHQLEMIIMTLGWTDAMTRVLSVVLAFDNGPYGWCMSGILLLLKWNTCSHQVAIVVAKAVRSAKSDGRDSWLWFCWENWIWKWWELVSLYCHMFYEGWWIVEILFNQIWNLYSNNYEIIYIYYIFFLEKVYILHLRVLYCIFFTWFMNPRPFDWVKPFKLADLVCVC